MIATVKGGKRLGAGRPVAPDRPKPVSWRPKTQAARELFFELGGSKWLNLLLEYKLNTSKDS